MTEAELKAGLAQYIAAVGALPPSNVGYKGGQVEAFRMGVYVEGRDSATGKIFVADPAEVALGRLAWREWVTVRGGQAGGRETVKPGGAGNPLGGFGLSGILQMLTGLPIAQALIAPTPPPPVATDDLQRLLIHYLQAKAGRMP